MQGHHFRVGDVICVASVEPVDKAETAHPGGEESGRGESGELQTETGKQWFAKIQEVRAADGDHVFLRVYWLYRPDELPGGRGIFHGRNELVLSTHMDILDVKSVDYKVDLREWRDDDEDADWVDGFGKYYWRQLYDYNTGELTVFSDGLEWSAVWSR